MVLVLAARAILMRWLSNTRAREAKDLIFEEEVPPKKVSLKLDA